MSYINKKKMKRLGTSILSWSCALTAVICLINKLPGSLSGNEDRISAMAAGFVMPDGAKAIIKDGYKSDNAKKLLGIEYDSTDYLGGDDLLEENKGQEGSVRINNNAVNNPIPWPNTTPAEGEAVYPVIEKHIAANGTIYNNFSVKNTTSVNIDIAEELNKRPDINIVKNSDPQVLIMHTHTCEAYMDKDQGFYPASFYPRSTDSNISVVRVADAISSELTKAGINTIHDTTIHDNPSYNGSYYRSEDTVKNYLKQYPGIKVVLDIHRDAIGNNDSGKVKPTFTYNGKKAAQVMIISGCDDDGSWDFPDWEYNLRFALRLQQTAENMYPGMTRPLKFCPSQYNMHLTHGSLLIEVGTDANTIDEAVYSGALLGNVLKEVLNNLTA